MVINGFGICYIKCLCVLSRYLSPVVEISDVLYLVKQTVPNIFYTWWMIIYIIQKLYFSYVWCILECFIKCEINSVGAKVKARGQIIDATSQKNCDVVPADFFWISSLNWIRITLGMENKQNYSHERTRKDLRITRTSHSGNNQLTKRR